MKRLIVVAAVFGALVAPLAARAQSPLTVEMPVGEMAAIQQFLLHPPMNDHIDPGDVMALLEVLDACAAVQTPVNGVTRDTGGCPAVSAAIRARHAAQEAAVAKAVAAQKATDDEAQKAKDAGAAAGPTGTPAAQ